MDTIALILAVLALITLVLRRNLWRPLIWAGLLALPIMFIKPLITPDFVDIAMQNGGVGWFLFVRAMTAFSLGLVASAAYETWLHRRISQAKHVDRPHLMLLVLGLAAFTVISVLAGLPLIIGVLVGLLVDLVIIATVRRHLMWDLLFSSIAMGLFYIVLYCVTMSAFPGDLQNVWFFEPLSGINLYSFPIEEVVVVALFGALFGPLYVAFKEIVPSPNAGPNRYIKQALSLIVVITLVITVAVVLKMAEGHPRFFGISILSRYSLAINTTAAAKKRVTAKPTVLLNIPFDRQDKALSCEAAALKMALRYKGVKVTETDIMNIIGYDSTIHDGKTWGDPNVAFVGNINGRQNTSGYGVHWDPIAKAAKQYRMAEAFSGWSTTDLAYRLRDGNPVVIWGTLGRSYYDPWNTPDGKEIKAWKGEHARTAIGFYGTVDKPTSFIINDPIRGRTVMTTAQLSTNWDAFGHSGVVVY